ncbi:uncharacterized protein [Nerophis lumbriciformis]|uniref:uncharacterized protein isoform X1 n=1 Tax=Nerophis lumbriciformis TaxID=546530 RepID=UPI002ADFEA11|nr:uncharacterized protein LOC133578416 isoform X1 [Nerophis lumbriciformis]XP_061788826.1 uncharacterized protein LOC133578416 isoform X1 [Nerophis lumbriciformis]XP_061788827.1 uncharacterized protein LOC133578416 isoform X1 [Nerophis lumbriciformis]
MDTCQKKRSAYFTPLELEILTESYSAFEDIFQRKSNSVSAVKEREAAWRTIADRVNACNLSSEKRTWSQLKMKYKNIIQTANRKKAEVRRASGEPAPSLSPARPPKEEEEEMAVSQDTGTIEGIKERCRPVLDGLRGGISSQPLAPQDTSAFVKYCDGVICLVEPNTLTPLIVADEDVKHSKSASTAWEFELSHAEAENDDARDTGSASTEWESEPPPAVSNAAHQENDSSTSSAKIDTLPVKDLYKMHLLKKMEKNDKQIMYLDLQMKKTDLEIEILKHKLEEMKNT